MNQRVLGFDLIVHKEEDLGQVTFFTNRIDICSFNKG